MIYQHSHWLACLSLFQKDLNNPICNHLGQVRSTCDVIFRASCRQGSGEAHVSQEHPLDIFSLAYAHSLLNMLKYCMHSCLSPCDTPVSR
jgi:hypothetical protein